MSGVGVHTALADPRGSAWTGIVLRPARASWDGTHYRGAALTAHHRDAVAALGPVQWVQHGNLLALAAPSAELVRTAAERCALRWGAPTDEIGPARPGASQPNTARTYAWPSPTGHSGDAVQAWAAWPSEHDLEVEVEGAEPAWLRRELAQVFALEPTRVQVVAVQRADGGPTALASESLDAAVDAAWIARAIGRPVRVEGPRLPRPDTVALSLSAPATPNADPTWVLTPTWPLAPRPAWSALAAGWTPPPLSARQAYGHALEVRPATQALTPRWSIDPRSAELATTFALESFADECAREAGRDPLQWRLERLSDPKGKALVQAVAERAAWRYGPPAAVSPAQGPRIGRGFAYAQTLDHSTEPPRQAWSAWVVDLRVDALAGRIDIAGLTVGHHVEGLYAMPLHDEAVQARIGAAAAQLLSGPQSATDWNGGTTSRQAPAVRVVDLAPRADSHALSDLSRSSALLLPMAAAIANAIYDATGIRLRSPPFDGAVLQRAAQQAMPAARTVPTGLENMPAEASTPRPLAPWRKAAAWLGAATAAVAGLAATAMPWRSAIAPVVPDLSVYASSAIERGRLIAAAGDCVVCHTAPGGMPNAGGLPMETAFGTLYSTNITPDRATGIGAWSYQAFERAMRHGIGRDGRHLYPAFPYTAFAKIDDGDMQALYAFLMSQPAVAHTPPPTELAFPYSVRPLMAGWNALFHDATPFTPDASQSVLWNRGAYLVNGIGHCGACHTPRNALGAEKSGPLDFLAGAPIKGWDAPALNRLTSGAQAWTREELYTYLRTGHAQRHGVAAGPMAPVIEGLSALPDRDILAMATYLTSLSDGTPTPAAASAPMPLAATPPPDAPALSAQHLPGARLFQGACAACHDPGRGMALFGVRPHLATNTNVHAERPDNLIQVILHGIQDPAAEDLGFMPGFAGTLSDQQIGDLVRYLRAEHAGDKPAWQRVEDSVARIRRSHTAQASMKASP